MDRLRIPEALTLKGDQAGASLVPPLEIARGEIAKIVFPLQNGGDMDLAEQLLVQQACRHGRSATVQLAMPPARWREMFHWQTTAEWLIAETGMTRNEAVEKLSCMQIQSEAPLCMQAGNLRWLLGFLAAMHRRPELLVFTTIGCDPLGTQRALQAVQSQLPHFAAIYLTCFTGLTIVEPKYATVIEIKSSKPQAA